MPDNDTFLDIPLHYEDLAAFLVPPQHGGREQVYDILAKLYREARDNETEAFDRKRNGDYTMLHELMERQTKLSEKLSGKYGLHWNEDGLTLSRWAGTACSGAVVVGGETVKNCYKEYVEKVLMELDDHADTDFCDLLKRVIIGAKVMIEKLMWPDVRSKSGRLVSAGALK